MSLPRPTTYHLVLDLETIPDPALASYNEKTGAGAADADGDEGAEEKPVFRAPPHHKIVVCGSLLLAGPEQDYRPLRTRLDTDECEGLKRLIQTLSDKRVQLITFAGRSFDMPVVMNRAFHYGLPFPRWFSRDGGDYRYRYATWPHVDLMDQMSEYGSALRGKMGDIARLIGLPGKMGGDGSKVAKLVEEGRIEEVKTYNLEDLVEEAGVFFRWLRLRGDLTAAAYTRAADHLLAFMGGEPRLAPLLAATDRARFRQVDPWEPKPPSGDSSVAA